MASRFAAEVERLEAALRTKRGRALISAVRTQVESFPVAVLAADDSSRYVAANTRAEELTGYSMAELSQLSVIDLTPVPNATEGRRLWDEFIATGQQQGRYDLRRKDGAFVPVHYWAYANIAPGIHLSVLMAEPTVSV